MEQNLIYKEECFSIIGCCIEVHKYLGKGFNEILYKDALEYEFKKNNIIFEREKEFKITYKDIILPHNYFADFIIENKIILEIKAVESLNSSHIKQTINYLAASKLKLGILVNFGEDSLKYKRIVL
ncbi:MAG: GxxExxY protein [Ignavibacteriales bacterium]|nr:GxxExxY protein [Ignavibacteriales bacterium]